MEPKGEQSQPEFTKYNLESFGQLLKVSASLPPDYFPYKVDIPVKSHFFQDLKNRVYKGEGGTFIEHAAILGVNDIGEILVSEKIFKGTSFVALTGTSKQEFTRLEAILKSIPFPPGWRTFGMVHSHPFDDIGFHIESLFDRSIPSVRGIPVSWSGADFQSFVNRAKHGHLGLTTYCMINPMQINFMVATSETVSKLNSSDILAIKSLNSEPELPPYESFQKLGIVLYSGNHIGKRNGEIHLERLI